MGIRIGVKRMMDEAVSIKHPTTNRNKGFDGVLDALKANGCGVLEGFPRKGIFGKIAFLSPPHSSQERIEIIERAAGNK